MSKVLIGGIFIIVMIASLLLFTQFSITAPNQPATDAFIVTNKDTTPMTLEDTRYPTNCEREQALSLSYCTNKVTTTQTGYIQLDAKGDFELSVYADLGSSGGACDVTSGIVSIKNQNTGAFDTIFSEDVPKGYSETYNNYNDAPCLETPYVIYKYTSKPITRYNCLLKKGGSGYINALNQIETKMIIAGKYVGDGTRSCMPEMTIEVSKQPEVIIIETPVTTPITLSSIIDNIWNWILNIIKNVPFSITGEDNVKPGEIYTYSIDMTVATPDHNQKDLTYETQHAYWALMDSDKNIIQGSENPVEINGTFKKDVTVTVPKRIDDYAVVGIITQIDSIYNLTTQKWENKEQQIILQEAINLKTDIPVFMKPTGESLTSLFSSLIKWFKSIFGW